MKSRVKSASLWFSKRYKHGCENGQGKTEQKQDQERLWQVQLKPILTLHKTVQKGEVDRAPGDPPGSALCATYYTRTAGGGSTVQSARFNPARQRRYRFLQRKLPVAPALRVTTRDCPVDERQV